MRGTVRVSDKVPHPENDASTERAVGEHRGRWLFEQTPRLSGWSLQIPEGELTSRDLQARLENEERWLGEHTPRPQPLAAHQDDEMMVEAPRIYRGLARPEISARSALAGRARCHRPCAQIPWTRASGS